jgi:TM2 domain-containing membrane protein YozV
MKTRTRILAALTTATLILAAAPAAKAEDARLKKKSVVVATLLALDPIPGDALFYAGKNRAGTINVIIGAMGGGVFWWGLIERLQMSDSERRDLAGLGIGLVIVGGALVYFPMLVWYAIGGISGTRSHNLRIEAAQK